MDSGNALGKQVSFGIPVGNLFNEFMDEVSVSELIVRCEILSYGVSSYFPPVAETLLLSPKWYLACKDSYSRTKVSSAIR